MMKFAVLVLATASVAAKEDLIRRRDLSSDPVVWRAAPEDEEQFVHLPDWGAAAAAERDHTQNSSSSTKVPKSSSTKVPKSSSTKGTKSSSTKGPKSSKSSSNRPPYSGTPPPAAAPTKCPEYDFEKRQCTAGSGNAKECKRDSSCKPACLPKYCKVPEDDPHKIHGYDRTEVVGDSYVELGSICGYFHYVEGMPAPRHAVEVCCVVEDDYDRSTSEAIDYLNYGKCDGCGACKYPQKVNDACCKIALGRIEELDGRDGDYTPYCGDGKVCCKCGEGNGSGSYRCIGKDEDCRLETCMYK